MRRGWIPWRWVPVTWALLAGGAGAFNQPIGEDLTPSEVLLVQQDRFLRWWGVAGRTYFLQVSDPADHLVKWYWAPVIETGNDGWISYEVGGTSDKGFYRLFSTSLQPPPGVSLEDWDADGDGMSNWEELQVGTNPFLFSTGGSGLPDGWAVRHGLDPFDPDLGTQDPDGDGSDNYAEYDGGTDPGDEADFPVKLTLAINVARLSSNNAQTSSLRRSPWNGGGGTLEPLDEGPTRQLLIEKLSEMGFPATVQEAIDGLPPMSQGIGASLSWEPGPMGGAHGVAAAARGWLQSPADPVAREFSFIKALTTFPSIGDQTVLEVDLLKVAKAANATASESFELKVPPERMGEFQRITELHLMAIQIREVEFSGPKYTELQSDNGAVTYSKPHWRDQDGNGRPTNALLGERNYPVAFTRNTRPLIGAKFRIPGAVNLENIEFKVRAQGPGGWVIPATTVEVEYDVDDHHNELTLIPQISGQALVNTVAFYDRDDPSKAYRLDWELQVGDSDWAAIGTTLHTVYVTLADPVTDFQQETLFEIGSRRGAGETTAAGTRTKAYEEFQTRQVRRVSDRMVLSYWKDNQQGAETTADLLASEDGNGVCNAWADFFRDVLRAQGITAHRAKVSPIVEITHPEEGFLAVREWTFEGAGTSPPPYPYKWSFDAHSQNGGIPAQNNDNPPKNFNVHYITFSGNIFYDPSYGTPAKADAKSYEDASFSGFGKKVPVSGGFFDYFLRKNNLAPGSAAEVNIQAFTHD